MHFVFFWTYWPLSEVGTQETLPESTRLGFSGEAFSVNLVGNLGEIPETILEEIQQKHLQKSKNKGKDEKYSRRN